MEIKVITKNILVDDNGKVLALKRSATDLRRPNCWDFPGGGKEQGEDIYDSAKREILEEIGLEVENLRVVYVASGMGIKDKDVLALCFVSESFGGQIKLSSEHSECKWVTPEEFLQLETGDDGGFLHNCVKKL